MRQLFFILGLSVSLLSSACAGPQLTGMSYRADHYRIVTDGEDIEFAKNVGLEAERIHRILAVYFKHEGETSDCRIQIATKFTSYKSLRKKSISSGEFHTGLFVFPTILVSWTNTVRGREILAHELVHHFVEETMPDLEDWKNEGLALALEGSAVPVEQTIVWEGQLEATVKVREWPARDYNVRSLRAMKPERLKVYFKTLNAFDKFSSDSTERHIIALVVRYGLETGKWSSLRDLKDWKPSFAGFEAWLRKAGPDWKGPYRPLLTPSETAPSPFGKMPVTYQFPKLKGAKVESEQFEIHSDEASSLRAGNLLLLAEKYHKIFRAYCGLPKRPKGTLKSEEKVLLYLFSDQRAFYKAQFRKRHSYWERLPGKKRCRVLFFWEGRRSFPDNYLNSRFIEMIVSCFTHKYLPKAPYWFRMGLTVALNHNEKYAARNPFRCPVTATSTSHTDSLYFEYLEDLSSYSKAKFEEAPCRSFAGLVARFGLETMNWKDLSEVRNWEPDGRAFLKWFRGSRPQYYRYFHKRFLALNETAKK